MPTPADIVLEAELRALNELTKAHETEGRTGQAASIQQLIDGLRLLLDAPESRELDALGKFVFGGGDEATDQVASDIVRYWDDHRAEVDSALSEGLRRPPLPYLLRMRTIAAETLVAARRAERRSHRDDILVSSACIDAEIDHLIAAGNVTMPARLRQQLQHHIPELAEFDLVFDFVQHRSELADAAAADVQDTWRHFRRQATLSGRHYLQGLLSHAETALPVTRHLREPRFRGWIDDKNKYYAAWQDVDELIGVIDVEFDEVSFDLVAGYTIRTREFWARGQPIEKWHWPVINHLGIGRLMPRAQCRR
jgi:hypothetical protein